MLTRIPYRSRVVAAPIHFPLIPALVVILALILAPGPGVAQDRAPDAQDLYQQAEEIRRSDSRPASLERARALYTEAAAQNYRLAFHRLGEVELKLGNTEAARTAFETAAERSDWSATVLADHHARGLFGPFSDPEKGLPVLREMAAADDGERARFTLAELIEDGVGTERDPSAAVEIYRDLAEAGDARALRKLGRMSLRGVDGAVPREVDTAISLLRQAAEEGSESARMDLGRALIEAGRFEEALAALEAARDAGVKGAAAELANAHYRQTLGPVSRPAEGEADLKRLAEDGDLKAARYALRHHERRSRRIDDLDVDRVIGHLWNLTAAGERSAASALHRVYRELDWMFTDEREQLARLVEDHGDVLGNRELPAARVSALYDRNAHRASQRAVEDYLENLDGPGFANAVMRLRGIEQQAYVRVVQSELRKEGFYDGPVNGLGTASTIRSMLEFCREEGFYDTCIHGPLGYQSGALIMQALEERR